jgi:hypothetical protein
VLELCPGEGSCPDEAVNVGRLLDYLARLDRWVTLYAWPICKEP